MEKITKKDWNRLLKKDMFLGILMVKPEDKEPFLLYQIYDGPHEDRQLWLSVDVERASETYGGNTAVEGVVIGLNMSQLLKVGKGKGKNKFKARK